MGCTCREDKLVGKMETSSYMHIIDPVLNFT